MAKLKASLPNGDRNGLAVLTGPLCDSPDTKHIVMMVVDCKSVTTDMDTGEVEPTARILRIEPVSRDDYHAAETLMRRALERRHGTTTLPFDTEAEIKAIFPQS